MILVIGSKALVHWIDIPNREAKDWDLICSRDEMVDLCQKLKVVPQQTSAAKWRVYTETYGQIEFEITDVSVSACMYVQSAKAELCSTDPKMIVGHVYGHYAPPTILFSIKKSHINYPRFWDKHIKDYHILKSHVGHDRYPEITKVRRTETEIRIGKLKTPSLDKTANDFFKDNVSNKTFIHDDIHSIMAHYDKPMFEYIKIDANKVACSKDKFFNQLSIIERRMCVLEEAYVIALERMIIPMLYESRPYRDPEEAFNWAVMRICTTLCSGWFRTFAVEEWPAITATHDKNYVTKFLKAVEDGRIKRIV